MQAEHRVAVEAAVEAQAREHEAQLLAQKKEHAKRLKSLNKQWKVPHIPNSKPSVNAMPNPTSKPRPHPDHHR